MKRLVRIGDRSIEVTGDILRLPDGPEEQPEKPKRQRRTTFSARLIEPSPFTKRLTPHEEVLLFETAGGKSSRKSRFAILVIFTAYLDAINKMLCRCERQATDDDAQDVYLLALRAIKEHDPSKGTFNSFLYSRIRGMLSDKRRMSRRGDALDHAISLEETNTGE